MYLLTVRTEYSVDSILCCQAAKKGTWRRVITKELNVFSLSLAVVLSDAQRHTYTGWQVWEAGFDVTSGASPFPIRLSRPPVWLLDEELCFRPAGLIKAPRAITASSCREIDPHAPLKLSWNPSNLSSPPLHLVFYQFTKKLPTTTQLYNPASHANHRSIPVIPPQSRWPTALTLNHTGGWWKSVLVLLSKLSHPDEFPRNFLPSLFLWPLL